MFLESCLLIIVAMLLFDLPPSCCFKFVLTSVSKTGSETGSKTGSATGSETGSKTGSATGCTTS